MKYPIIRINEKDESTVLHLLKEVNRRLKVLHRLAEKNLKEDYEEEYEALNNYLSAYVECMIFSCAAYYPWLYKRLRDKISAQCTVDQTALQERIWSARHWALGY